MSVIYKRIISILLIINLILTGAILSGKLVIIHKFAAGVAKTLLIPLFIAALFFYIMRPLNNNFIKKGMGRNKASFLTLIICSFILSGLLYYFSNYAYRQFIQVSRQLIISTRGNKNISGIINYINSIVSGNELYSLAVDMTKNYMQKIGHNFKSVIGYFTNTFSMVFLIIVIVFYMLKDGDKFKPNVLRFVPHKYKDMANELLSESDTIISSYVIGQSKVALSLSIMIFIGYKIIGMPNAMLLSSITFILAFIPFVGFFISMIIPIVIALGMGIIMFAKLLAVFLVVQTLKGRVVVPAIMAKAMKIHPLTDIFLVISAIAVAGPFAAFVVVPLYVICKNAVKKIFHSI